MKTLSGIIREVKYSLEDLMLLKKAVDEYKAAKTSRSFWVWCKGTGYARDFSNDICDYIKNGTINLEIN